MTDQYEGWNREMLLDLVNDLKNRNAKLQEKYDGMMETAVSAIDDYRQRIEELESGNQWRTLTETDKPRYFEAFLLEWDGHWQRATMLGAVEPGVSIYWHGREDIRPFGDLLGRRWMRVPRLPKAKEPTQE